MAKGTSSRRICSVLAAIAWISASGVVRGEVRSSTELQSYVVGGTSAPGLVAYMRRRPFPGDNGPAVANIRPHYTLSVDTINADAVCRPKDIDLSIDFVMTLPQAKTPGAFSAWTQSAWSSFVDFARRHEETHRGIYLDCAEDFTAKAMQLAASNCTTLRDIIATMFKSENRACDRRQLAFDRAQYRLVLGLSLFATARHAGHKPLPASGFGASSAMRGPSR